jgi:DNA-binding LacI/PurR family transcriptional regulator
MDVAKAAGVNYSTVSLALRSDPRIRESTREKVEQVARQLNYTPNSLARSLSGGSTKVIGVMFTEMSPYFVRPLEILQQTFEQEGYTLSLHFSGWNTERERNGLIHFCENRVDGILWASAEWKGEHFVQANELLQRHHTPYVMFGLADESSPVVCNQVGGLIEESIHLSVSYLKSLGHERIGLATATTMPGGVGGMHRLRLQMFKKVFADCHLSLRDEDMLETPDHDHGGLEIALRLCRDRARGCPSAIIAVDDMLARGLVKGLTALGVKVPEEMCLMGLDVLSTELSGVKPLTSVSLEAEEGTRRAARMLMRKIGKPSDSSPIEKVIIAPKLIPGSTCIPLAQMVR